MARIRQKTLQFPGLNNVYTFADEADLFDSNTACKAGKYYIYDGDLYKCKTDHTGAWDATHFTAVKLGDEIAAQSEAIDAMGEVLVKDVNVSTIWEQGSFKTGLSGGDIQNNTTKSIVESTFYQAENTTLECLDATHKFNIAVYDSSEGWIGFWRSDKTTNAYTGTDFTSSDGEVNCGVIAETIQNALIRIIIKSTSSSNDVAASEYTSLSIKQRNFYSRTEIDTKLAKKITAPSSPTSGQFLVYNGTAWVAQTVPSGNGVSF